MKHSIIILMIIIPLVNSCVSSECKITGGYQFEIPVSLDPKSDTISIGDTISVISIFPDDVYEIKTDSYYKLEDFSFFPKTRIIKIDTFPAKTTAIKYFDVLIDNSYDYKINTNFLNVYELGGQYSYSNNEYSLIFQIIPRNPGLYYFRQACALELNHRPDFKGKCSNINEVEASVKLNSGEGNNIEFLEVSPDPHYNEWILNKPEERFHNYGGFCFYVQRK